MPKINFNFKTSGVFGIVGANASVVFSLVVDALHKIADVSDLVEVVIIECDDTRKTQMRFRVKTILSFSGGFDMSLDRKRIKLPKIELMHFVYAEDDVDKVHHEKFKSELIADIHGAIRDKIAGLDESSKSLARAVHEIAAACS